MTYSQANEKTTYDQIVKVDPSKIIASRTLVERPLRMDAELWFRDWAIQHEGFPDDYLVIDIETTGGDVETDLITQLGWCRVENRKIVDNNGVLLNWVRSPHVDTNWLRRRMEATDKQMTTDLGKGLPFDFSSLASGQNPIKALADFVKLLCEVRQRDCLLVAHNGVCFDMPILTRHFQRFLKLNYYFHPEEIWDTGALEKAVQLDEILCEGELPGNFAYRVIMRSNDGVHWSLHGHSVPKYNLQQRFALDMAQSHTAPFDAYVTHLLLEEFRKLAERGLERDPADERSDSC